MEIKRSSLVLKNIVETSAALPHPIRLTIPILPIVRSKRSQREV